MRAKMVGEKSRFLNAKCKHCAKPIRVDTVVLFQYFDVGRHRALVTYHKDCMERVLSKAPKTLMDTRTAFREARDDLLTGIKNGEYGATKEEATA